MCMNSVTRAATFWWGCPSSVSFLWGVHYAFVYPLQQVLSQKEASSLCGADAALQRPHKSGVNDVTGLLRLTDSSQENEACEQAHCQHLNIEYVEIALSLHCLLYLNLLLNGVDWTPPVGFSGSQTQMAKVLTFETSFHHPGSPPTMKPNDGTPGTGRSPACQSKPSVPKCQG